MRLNDSMPLKYCLKLSEVLKCHLCILWWISRALSLSAFGGASPLDVAFRMCALGIEKQVARPGGEELCLFIMDDTKDARLKNQLKCSFSSLRKRFGPPTWNSGRLWSVRDDMYFGASKDSVGIQIADLCNYFVARKLKMNGGGHSFYDIFSDRVICSKIEPEWTQLERVSWNWEFRWLNEITQTNLSGAVHVLSGISGSTRG